MIKTYYFYLLFYIDELVEYLFILGLYILKFSYAFFFEYYLLVLK